MARTKQTARKWLGKPDEGTFGYSCTLYKDFLIFFGGTYDGEPITRISVYNLKEERMEEDQSNAKSMAFDGKFGHAACYYEVRNIIIFLGGEPSHGGYEDSSCNPALRLRDEGDGLSWHLTYGIDAPAMESPIGRFYKNKLFVFQPGEYGDVGLLRSYDIETARWQEPHPNYDLKLDRSSNNAIFVQDKLYLFAQGYHPNPSAIPHGGCFIEDVYVLDISTEGNKWEKVSCSGQAPGFVSNVSMVEANGTIYIFGVSYSQEGEKKSVLWAFDTKEEKWSIVPDSEGLSARPNQRAVIYKGRLLVIDWDYLTQTIGIQNHTLAAGENFISQSPDGKDLCKDQDEAFIQDAKSLYNSRLFPDVVFEVEGEEIPAHKALLAYRSDYFMKMFTSGMSESQSAKIPISNMKPHIFKAILQYIYCNELELDEQLALDLIPVIDEYLMNGLKGLCEKYLCKQLRKENVVDMLIVADKHDIGELKKACFRFIIKNLASIDENEEMMKLSKSLFLELLKFNTSGLQQKSNIKGEKKKEDEEEEETKSNLDFAIRKSPMKPTGFAFQYAEPTRKAASSLFGGAAAFGYPKATFPMKERAVSRSKSRSRSPTQIMVKAKK